ncbi:cytochrome b/b6 domain-containing protein [Streptomyces venetus]|uniref:cytochrome b/b6 domain-containing protein n=1 Tax=Streptomyces venetus TaxID=1701086 RepID=UPI003C2ADE7E
MTNDSTVDDSFADFLNFGAGVLSLVCLTCSVIWGLVAQDRVLLDTRRRILAQAVHRTTAVASIVFLLVHIGVKLALAHTSFVAAVIPFGLLLTDEIDTGRAYLIGLGTLAGLLMIFVGVTGVLRNRFASPAPVAARWRAMHMLAYPAWCAALIHGLYAGRSAKPIFVILYCLSLAGVAGALALRAAPRPVKRKVADKITSIFGSPEGQAFRDLEESRSRATGGSSLPGYEGREAFAGAKASPSAPLYEKAERPAPQESANGFAAAYRAVSGPPQGQQAFAAPGPTTRTELPLDMQPTQTIPTVDGPSSTSGNWPIPSPPPVGEAPPSAYDPLQDTGFNIPPYDPLQDTGQSIPAYGNPGAAGYGSSDVYDTGETNAVYDTYYPNDTYNSGPANETNPGASYDFDAPGSGEPWNTPSGGFK